MFNTEKRSTETSLRCFGLFVVHVKTTCACLKTFLSDGNAPLLGSLLSTITDNGTRRFDALALSLGTCTIDGDCCSVRLFWPFCSIQSSPSTCYDEATVSKPGAQEGVLLFKIVFNQPAAEQEGVPVAEEGVAEEGVLLFKIEMVWLILPRTLGR